MPSDTARALVLLAHYAERYHLDPGSCNEGDAEAIRGLLQLPDLQHLKTLMAQVELDRMKGQKDGRRRNQRSL